MHPEIYRRRSILSKSDRKRSDANVLFRNPNLANCLCAKTGAEAVLQSAERWFRHAFHLSLLFVISRNLANISLVISGRTKFPPRTRDIHPRPTNERRERTRSPPPPNTQCQCRRFVRRTTRDSRRISEDCIGKEGKGGACLGALTERAAARRMGPNKTAERSSNKSPNPSENVASRGNLRGLPLSLLPSFLPFD